MAVKLYTPDANVIVHQAKVDFRRRIVQRQVNLVQYDKSMPIIAVQLYSNGNEYVLPETASAYIRFGKRDHTYVYNECLGCDQTRTIVYFAITDQMTVFYGEHTPIVELRIGDTVAGSGSIPIWIDRNPIQNGDTESKSDLSVFEKAIEAAQKIDVKLPTDLKATATNLSLLAGSTKIGSGINLSGFEYDEATKTLKASGGGSSVSPCLNLMDMTARPATIRTSITEEEKNNLDKGLYNSVLYFDASAGPLGFISTFFPEPLTSIDGDTEFSIFNFTADEATEKITITSSSVYQIDIDVFNKNEDGTYPISIRKQEGLEATFGGGSGGAIQEIEAIKTPVEPKILAKSGDDFVQYDYTQYTLSSTPTSPVYMMKVNNDDGTYSRITMILQSSLDTSEQGYYGCKIGSLSDINTCVYAYSSGNFAMISNQGYLPPQIKSGDAGKVLVAGDNGYILENLSTMAEKTVSIVKALAVKNIPFIQKYHGIYGCYRILYSSITVGSITVSGELSSDVIFLGYPFVYGDNNEGNGYLMGSIYMGTLKPRSANDKFYYSLVGTGVYEFSNGKINITPKGCVGNMTLSGLALLAGHETTSDEITTAINNGNNAAVSYDVNLMALQYGFKETTDGAAATKTFLGYVDGDVYSRLTLSGLFNGKQGTAVLEKDSSGNWISNTPIEYAGAQETHHHTLTIKENGRIVFAANRELESATAATNLETLISTFAGTTTAGFGDYILLTVDTAAKLKKQDGTEVNLSTLNVTIEDIL